MQALSSIVPIPSSNLLSYVNKRTGQNISSCYQCGKCSAGCPTAYAMDIPPRQIMRALQLGLKDEILSSSAIWLCLSCHTCSQRCPREIDIAGVMEALRLLAISEGKRPREKDIAVFYKAFIEQIRMFGRVYEAGLGVSYNLRSMHLLNNAARLPALIGKRKLHLRPPRTSGAPEVRKIAARVKNLESSQAQL